MERSSITRNDLKKNFLKEIIMRLDFQGVLQMEMEGILLDVKPYLKEALFNRYEEKVVNQIVNEGTSVTDVKSQMVYSFTAESLGYLIELSNTSVTLTVRSQTYSSFDEYSAIFCHIVSIYKKKIDFFTVKRFGLRKINFCFIKNRNEINQYVVSSYYNCDAPIEGFESQAIEHVDRLSDSASNLNLRYVIEGGTLETEHFYKVTLDSDIYTLDQDKITEIMFNAASLKEINEKLFRIYLNVLTDYFLEILTTDSVSASDSIVGVELNEAI